MKRILALSDLHCGHIVGLTPPDHQRGKCKGKFREIAQENWRHFKQAKGEYDAVVVNGDLIDGNGQSHGGSGTEHIETDRTAQAEMAAECIAAVVPNKSTPIYLTYGTASHTGKKEDFEDIVQLKLEVLGYRVPKVTSHLWLKVEGVMFDFKHHIGSSGVPHGRHTAAAKERLWNVLWAEREQCPKAHVVVRSHVHYYDFCGGPDWLAMTTPALQGLGSKYGARRCNGLVDFGYITFTVDGDKWDWEPNILRYKAQADKAEVLA